LHVPVSPHRQHHHDVEACDGEDEVEKRVAVSNTTDFIVVDRLTTVKVLSMFICVTRRSASHYKYNHLSKCRFYTQETAAIYKNPETFLLAICVVLISIQTNINELMTVMINHLQWHLPFYCVWDECHLE